MAACGSASERIWNLPSSRNSQVSATSTRLLRSRAAGGAGKGAAARTLAASVGEDDLAQGSLYPPLNRVRDVSAHIATSVAEVAFRNDFAGVERPDDVLEYIRSQMYEPVYASYVA